MHNCVCMYRYRCTPCLIHSSALKLSVRKSTSLKSRHFEQLLKLFEHFGTPDKRRYLFLGGYVNKGPRSLDTTCLLFLYKAISGRPERILETSPILTFWVVETEDSLVLMARIFWNSGFLTVWLDCPVLQHHRCHCDRDMYSGLLLGDSILYLRWYL